jgi:F-type H+-transporting ATPase subunit b
MKISGIYRKGFPTFIIILVQICLVFPKIVFGSSGESGGGGVTVIPDGSIIIQIINFLFAIWVLNVLLYKPIRKILTQRKEKVSGLELAIETSNNDVREKDDAFAAGMKEARTKGFKEKDALLQQAADEEKSILDDINRKAQAELTQIRDQIKKDAEVARESLQAQIGDFANQISQKILGRAV